MRRCLAFSGSPVGLLPGREATRPHAAAAVPSPPGAPLTLPRAWPDGGPRAAWPQWPAQQASWPHQAAACPNEPQPRACSRARRPRREGGDSTPCLGREGGRSHGSAVMSATHCHVEHQAGAPPSFALNATPVPSSPLLPQLKMDVMAEDFAAMLRDTLDKVQAQGKPVETSASASAT